jgi:hypothetical protein
MSKRSVDLIHIDLFRVCLLLLHLITFFGHTKDFFLFFLVTLFPVCSTKITQTITSITYASCTKCQNKLPCNSIVLDINKIFITIKKIYHKIKIT